MAAFLPDVCAGAGGGVWTAGCAGGGREVKTSDDAVCETLNRRYGAPGRIVFRPSRHGAPIAVLANQYGTAELALFGAQTLSYRPTGHLPVLYMPHPYDAHPAGTEIHGGIPVCWPWFAAQGEPGAKMHGLARYATWSVTGSEYSEDATELTLGLSDSPATRAVWPYAFELALKVSVSMKLTLTLTAKNTDDKPFFVTEGFHPYFRVRDRDQTDVLGVDGCTFLDLDEPEKTGRIWTGACAVRKGGSRLFDVTKREHVLMDHALHRAIALVSRGNARLVVWNPGEESAADEASYGPDGWRQFVCVEPATTGREVGYELKPGESHTLVMAVQSVADGRGAAG